MQGSLASSMNLSRSSVINSVQQPHTQNTAADPECNCKLTLACCAYCEWHATLICALCNGHVTRICTMLCRYAPICTMLHTVACCAILLAICTNMHQYAPCCTRSVGLDLDLGSWNKRLQIIGVGDQCAQRLQQLVRL